jgi:hypothetical protein
MQLKEMLVINFVKASNTRRWDVQMNDLLLDHLQRTVFNVVVCRIFQRGAKRCVVQSEGEPKRALAHATQHADEVNVNDEASKIK